MQEHSERIENRGTPTLVGSKHLVLIAFAMAVYVSLAQFSPYPFLSGSAFKLAYVVFPFLILSIFFVVYSYSRTQIREAWRKKSWKWLSWTAGIGYVMFYIVVTNTISVPDPGVAIPADLSHGYILPFAAYGPMTLWPDVEFYFPSMNLTGYLSMGNVLLFVSFGLLVSFSVSLLIQNITTRTSTSKRPSAPLAGVVFTAIATNACCCCTPAIFPILAILFGGVMPGAIAESLVNPQSPVSNLLALGTLASLTASTLLSTKCNRGA